MYKDICIHENFAVDECFYTKGDLWLCKTYKKDEYSPCEVRRQKGDWHKALLLHVYQKVGETSLHKTQKFRFHDRSASTKATFRDITSAELQGKLQISLSQ